MGILTQASSAVANSSKISVSMWCQVPDGLSGQITLLEFGDFSDGTQFSPSAITLNSATNDFIPTLLVSFNGPANSVSPLDCLTGDWQRSQNMPYNEAYDWTNTGTDPPTTFHVDAGAYNVIVGIGDQLTPQLFTRAWGYDPGFSAGNKAAAIGMFDAGKWFHIFAAFDASHSCSIGRGEDGGAFPISTNRAALFVNAVNQSANNSWTLTGQDLTNPWIATDRSMTDVFSNQTIFDEFPDLNVGFNPDARGAFDNGTGLSWGAAGVTTPAFEFAIAGFPFTLPSINFRIGAPRVRYGPVQIYVGQYIDPIVNLGAFVNLVGGRGTPVPSSVAAANFGRQTFLFEGNAASFPFNLGTGGAFTQVGTILDASPGPSF